MINLIKLTSVHVVIIQVQSIYRVSKKLCQCYFLNNSVKHWPTLIIFGTEHHKETWRKWP